MEIEIITERGYGSDVTPRPIASVHYEPNHPGATSLRDARPLWIDGKHVTAELYQGKITIFLGCEIIYQGPLPKGITDGEINGWVADYALGYQGDVRVILAWRARDITPELEGLYEEAEQPAESLRIMTQRTPDRSTFVIREPITDLGIMICGSHDLTSYVANMIEMNGINPADLIERGAITYLEEKMVEILRAAQAALKIRIQAWGWDITTVTPTEGQPVRSA